MHNFALFSISHLNNEDCAVLAEALLYRCYCSMRVGLTCTFSGVEHSVTKILEVPGNFRYVGGRFSASKNTSNPICTNFKRPKNFVRKNGVSYKPGFGNGNYITDGLLGPAKHSV